jgi:putative nucleotidyltransferase with HDIG domain
MMIVMINKTHSSLRKAADILTHVFVFGFFFGVFYAISYYVQLYLTTLSLTVVIIGIFFSAVIFRPTLLGLHRLAENQPFAEVNFAREIIAGYLQENKAAAGITIGPAERSDEKVHFPEIAQVDSEFAKFIDGLVFAVSLVFESRDPYTAGHQRRVAGLAKAIAGKMGLAEQQVMGIHLAAQLHDVGKIAIPFEILNKPGKITENEFNIIKSHCRIGYEILQKIKFPWPVNMAILQHHERLNGSGYPSGLSDGEILLEARILGVADVVEAMSSHRPYRPALGLQSALAEISRGSGILYDSEVVDACLSLFHQNESEFDRIINSIPVADYALQMVK